LRWVENGTLRGGATTPGIDAEVTSNLRAQLESSTLAGGPRVDSALRPMGAGINADYKA
jgi:hypothetical protein